MTRFRVSGMRRSHQISVFKATCAPLASSSQPQQSKPMPLYNSSPIGADPALSNQGLEALANKYYALKKASREIESALESIEEQEEAMFVLITGLACKSLELNTLTGEVKELVATLAAVSLVLALLEKSREAAIKIASAWRASWPGSEQADDDECCRLVHKYLSPIGQKIEAKIAASVERISESTDFICSLKNLMESRNDLDIDDID